MYNGTKVQMYKRTKVQTYKSANVLKLKHNKFCMNSLMFACIKIIPNPCFYAEYAYICTVH